MSVPKILLVGGAGYVGSYLQKRLDAEGYSIDICDTGVRGFPNGVVDYNCDYDQLSDEALSPYSHVLWFAGHSSVRAAMSDPQGALHNNCLNLVRLRERMPPAARLIYTSTASVYSTVAADPGAQVPEAHETYNLIANINSYDISKFTFDYIAQGFLKNFIGLRLGTVSGWSPNLRPELLFNAMNLAAIHDGIVRVANPKISRSIVFLDDLCNVVRTCIDRPDLEDGFFNIASATATIGEFAESIANFYGAKIEIMPDSVTYSFRLNTDRAKLLLGAKFDGDFRRRCNEFHHAVKTANELHHARKGAVA